MNIIITGASTGIGYETALLFSSNSKNKIIVIARSKDKLLKLQEESLKNKPQTISNIIPLPFDLEKIDSYKDELIPLISFHFKHIDILINNAAYLVNKPFQDTYLEDWIKTFQINLFSPTKLTQELLPYMGKDKLTHIVNIGSMGGVQGSAKFKGLSCYSASKAALANLTECLAEEFNNKNIKINCLALGSVQTEMLAKAFPNYKAPIDAKSMALFISEFCLTGYKFFNGKILPVSLSIP